MRPIRKLYFEDYFALNFVVTSPMTTLLMAQKETTIRSTRIGLNARLKIMTTHFHLISSPYMSECNEQGMSCLIYPNIRPQSSTFFAGNWNPKIIIQSL